MVRNKFYCFFVQEDKRENECYAYKGTTCRWQACTYLFAWTWDYACTLHKSKCTLHLVLRIMKMWKLTMQGGAKVSFSSVYFQYLPSKLYSQLSTDDLLATHPAQLAPTVIIMHFRSGFGLAFVPLSFCSTRRLYRHADTQTSNCNSLLTANRLPLPLVHLGSMKPILTFRIMATWLIAVEGEFPIETLCK